MLIKMLWCSVCVFLHLFAASCAKDKGKSPGINSFLQSCSAKYTEDVRPIILNKCSVEHCHVTNFTFGDFTSYADLKLRIDSGKIDRFVFEFELMPPANSTQLTTQELESLKCWINNGAPEN